MASSVYVSKERDKYGRSVTYYDGHAGGVNEKGQAIRGARVGSACIVRVPNAKANGRPPYFVNTDRINGRSNAEGVVVDVATLKQARAIVEALPWVASAETRYGG